MGESSSSAAQALERFNARTASVGLTGKPGTIFAGAHFSEVLKRIAQMPEKERKPAIAQFVHDFSSVTEEVSVGFTEFKDGATKLVGNVEDIFRPHKDIIKNGDRIRADREALRKTLREEFPGGEMDFPFFTDVLQTNDWTKNTCYFVRKEKPLFLEQYPENKGTDLSKSEHFVRYCAMRLSQSQQYQVGKADHVRGAQKMDFAPVNVDLRRHWKQKRSELENVKIFSASSKKLRLEKGFKLDRLGFTVKRSDEEMGDEDLSEPTTVDPPPPAVSESGSTPMPESRGVTPVALIPGLRESRQATPVAGTPGFAGLDQQLRDSTLAPARKPTASSSASVPAPELMITTSRRPLRNTNARRDFAERQKTATPARKKKDAAASAPQASLAPSSVLTEADEERIEQLREEAGLPPIEVADDDDPFADTPCNDCSRWLFKSDKEDSSNPKLFQRCFIDKKYALDTDVMVRKREIADDYVKIRHSSVRESSFCTKHVAQLGELLGLVPVRSKYPSTATISRIEKMAGVSSVAGLQSLTRSFSKWFTPEFVAATNAKVATTFDNPPPDEDDEEDAVVLSDRGAAEDAFGDQFRLRQPTFSTALTTEGRQHPRKLLGSTFFSVFEQEGAVNIVDSPARVPDKLLGLMRREFDLYRWHGKTGQFGHNYMMWHSMTQQILRRNPANFLFYLVASNAEDFRVITYPAPAIHCYNDAGGDNMPDGLQFIAAKEDVLRRGDDQQVLHVVTGLDDATDARQLLTAAQGGFLVKENAKIWVKHLSDKRAATNVGFTDAGPSVEFSDFCRKVGASWKDANIAAGSVTMSHPYVPQRLQGGASEFRAVPVQYLPFDDSTNRWRLKSGGMLAVDPSDVAEAHRSRRVLDRTAFGFVYPRVLSEKKFAVERSIFPLGPVSEALVGRLGWDEPEVLLEMDAYLTMTPERFEELMQKWWADAFVYMEQGLDKILTLEGNVFEEGSFSQNGGDFARAAATKPDEFYPDDMVTRVAMDDRI